MAKKRILTPHQIQFLNFISNEPYIIKNFYLTGGTALSIFYLHHRISEGLDFFCEKDEVNTIIIENILGKFRKETKLSKIEHRSTFGLHNFFLHFSSRDVLRVDFSHYSYPRISKGTKFGNIIIDSEYDIAVNKIQTISMQARSRDFIDLYFLIKEKGYTLHDLLLKAKAKFDWHIDPIQLGSRFLEALELRDFPLMIKNIDHREWQEFFANNARKLEAKIFNKR